MQRVTSLSMLTCLCVKNKRNALMGAGGRALVSLYLDSIKTILYVRRIVSACFSQCTAVPASQGLAACQALARGNMKVAGTWLWVGGVHEARQRLKTSDIWLFCSLGTTTTTSVSFSYLNLPCLPQFQEHSFFFFFLPPAKLFLKPREKIWRQRFVSLVSV